MSNDTVIPSYDFAKICRICLQSAHLVSFFDYYWVGEELKICDLFEYCLMVKIREKDELPQKICGKCLDHLRQMYMFKKRYLKSENLLRALITSEHLESDVADLHTNSGIVDKCTIKVNKNETLCEESSEQKMSDNFELEEYEEIHVETEENVETNFEHRCTDGNEQQLTYVKANANRELSTHCNDIKVDISDENQIVVEVVEPIDIINEVTIQTDNSTAEDVERKVPARYKCRVCLMSFATKEDISKHRRLTKHGNKLMLPCSVCNRMITTTKMRDHMRTHTKEKPFVCTICQQGFSLKQNLKRHTMTHTGERPYVCSICGKGFIQAVSLSVHMKIHSTKTHLDRRSREYYEQLHSSITCKLCGRFFKRCTPYLLHMKTHHEGEYDTSVDDMAADRTEKTHPFQCTTCSRRYQTKSQLRSHQVCHREKTWLCQECGQKFTSKANLESHTKVHTGDKPFRCHVCGKAFTQGSSLDVHMLLHSGSKPHKCPYCEKAFTQSGHLTYHLRTHSGEKPYQCPHCNKRFSVKSTLTVHVRTHTGETPYTCPVCAKGFYHSSTMKKHALTHNKPSKQFGHTTSGFYHAVSRKGNVTDDVR